MLPPVPGAHNHATYGVPAPNPGVPMAYVWQAGVPVPAAGASAAELQSYLTHATEQILEQRGRQAVAQMSMPQSRQRPPAGNGYSGQVPVLPAPSSPTRQLNVPQPPPAGQHYRDDVENGDNAQQPPQGGGGVRGPSRDARQRGKSRERTAGHPAADAAAAGGPPATRHKMQQLETDLHQHQNALGKLKEQAKEWETTVHTLKAQLKNAKLKEKELTKAVQGGARGAVQPPPRAETAPKPEVAHPSKAAGGQLRPTAALKPSRQHQQPALLPPVGQRRVAHQVAEDDDDDDDDEPAEAGHADGRFRPITAPNPAGAISSHNGSSHVPGGGVGKYGSAVPLIRNLDTVDPSSKFASNKWLASPREPPPGAEHMSTITPAKPPRAQHSSTGPAPLVPPSPPVLLSWHALEDMGVNRPSPIITRLQAQQLWTLFATSGLSVEGSSAGKPKASPSVKRGGVARQNDCDSSVDSTKGGATASGSALRTYETFDELGAGEEADDDDDGDARGARQDGLHRSLVTKRAPPQAPEEKRRAAPPPLSVAHLSVKGSR